MPERVLCVDDEPSMLSMYRTLFEPDFTVETADCAEAALTVLAQHGPFAVVLSDLHMPGTDGIRLLAAVRQRHPDTTRVLLSGMADLASALQAVNDGQVFRFLTKPVAMATLRQAVAAGVEQYRLVTAQRDLLESTLRGAVHVLGELLALANPPAFERATRVRQLLRVMSTAAGRELPWEEDVAAALSQIGCIAVPDAVLAKVDRGEPLTDAEEHTFERHAAAGAEILRPVPRLGRVAELIGNQHRRRLDAGSGVDDLGAGLLKAAIDFDALLRSGRSTAAALETMRQRLGWYHPAALRALEAFANREAPNEPREIPVAWLSAGMVMAADVVSAAGLPLVRAGVRVTDSIRVRLQSMAATGHILGTVTVMVPAA